jgi:fatty-acyl-CoA synthase
MIDARRARSCYLPAALPASPRTLIEALERAPADPARGFRFIGSDGTERAFSWAMMRRETERRGALLAGSGVQPGDRIALVVPEGHEFVLAFLAAVAAGAVPVPIFPRATFKASSDYVDTVAHIVEASGASLLLCMDANQALVAPAKHRAASLKRIATIEDIFSQEITLPALATPRIKPDDLCFLQFTSGSTSRPKGVMVTHENLLANTRAFLGPVGLDRRDDDIGVSWLPLFHDMGLIGFVLGPLLFDVPVVILPTATFARGPKIWLETISRVRGTITYAPNFAYALAVKRLKPKDLESLDLSCLRVAGCGAEPIHAETLRSFARALEPAGFKSTALLPSYGMAESTLAITFHPRDTPLAVDRVDPEALRRGEAVPTSAADAIEVVSCGVPFPGHDLAIFDEAGNDLPERRVGEIVARGPSVCRGYFENAEATAESFPADGWLHSGDLGYIANGTLHVCGRIKDLVIIRGANFHPQDLEWAVSELEGVRRGNAAAFSVPVDGEERLIVAVECASGDASDVRQRVSARVAEGFGITPYAVVTVGLGSLPKTSSGKIQRRKARDLYQGGQLDEHPAADPGDGGERKN